MNLKGRRRQAEASRQPAQAAAAPSRPDRSATSATVFKQMQVDATSTSWTVQRVRAALDKHETGDFSESSLLVDAMGRDDRIDACLNTRVNAVASKNGLDFSIIPPDGGDQKLADLVSKWWFDAITDASLKALLADQIMLGVAIGRVYWELVERKWTIKRVERWHLSNVAWRADIERFVAQTTTGEQVIEPGDPNWLVITPAGDRSWMAGAVRALGVPFVMRQWNWRDWSNFNERHGIPIIAIKEPAGFDKAIKDGFYKSLKSIGSKGILRLPQDENGTAGFDAKFLEPMGRSFDSFKGFRADLDVGIAVYLLGQNLTTEVSGGSFAAATVHGRVRNDYLCADTEGLAVPLRDQIIKPWGLFNLPRFDPSMAPWPHWDCELPEDLGGDATTLKTFGEALTSMEAAGLPVDGEELAARYKVPLRKGEKYTGPKTPEPIDPAAVPGAAPTKPTNRMQRPQMLSASGVLEGQTYADDVVDDARTLAGEGLKPFLADLVEVVTSSSDYDDLRRKVLAKWSASESPTRVRDILQKAMMLGNLAGRAGVLQDAT